MCCVIISKSILDFDIIGIEINVQVAKFTVT